MEKVLVLGSGGREDTLVWKLLDDGNCQVFAAPGNAGMAARTTCFDIDIGDHGAVIELCRKEGITLAVVGPEAPLVAGLRDDLEAAGFAVFGPTKAAAQLEGSKVFTKEIMRDLGVPSSEFEVFTDYLAAVAYIDSREDGPIVVKADGLAAGKGAIVCKDNAEAREALGTIMDERAFGDAGDAVVIEEFMVGIEASVLAFVDGKNILTLEAAKDHKPVGDGDTGPNTGGMGAYSPAPHVTPEILQITHDRILRPVVDGMAARGMPYQGILYAGLMITDKGPKVVEFNCRFGDPEVQAILPRLTTPLLPIMRSCIEGTLDDMQLEWRTDAACSVVLASGGYPGSYPKGLPISGITEAEADGAMVFHAGTGIIDGRTVTAGGRVMAITSFGPSVEAAADLAYQAAGKVDFDGMYMRTDIGRTLRQ